MCGRWWDRYPQKLMAFFDGCRDAIDTERMLVIRCVVLGQHVAWEAPVEKVEGFWIRRDGGCLLHINT